MDILTIGVDAAIIGSVIAICNVIKGFDKANRYARFYPVLPLVFGTFAALVKAEAWTFQAVGEAMIKYVGLSSYMFQFGKTTLLNK